MANFVAITPPLGQGTWGLVPVLPQQGFAFPVTIGRSFSYEELGYPPLSAPLRVIILKKYPGTIFPDPGSEDVIPCAKPDPIHIEELWVKHHAVLTDRQLWNDLPKRDLGSFIEREVAEWVAEYDEAQHLTVLVIAEAKAITMGIIKGESKKRARGVAFEDDATNVKESRLAKLAKKNSPATTARKSLKETYDNIWPTDIIAEEGSPAYVMALTYLKAYAHSDEKYAHRVREIFAKQGEEIITQRCARFFAWGLKQALHAPKAEATQESTESASGAGSATQPTTMSTESASGAGSAPQTTTMSTTAAVEVTSEDEDEENSEYEELNLDDDESDSDDEIINFQPRDKKPTFKFEPSNLSERLGSFVSELKGANEQLVAEGGANLSMELTDSDEGEHIELNLGLGVLEEVCNDDKIIIPQV